MPSIEGRQEKSMVEKGLVSLSIFSGIQPNDYVLRAGEILTITGRKGMGKTTLTAAVGTREMLPPNAWFKVKKAREDAERLRQRGYRKAHISKKIKHLVYSEFPMCTCNDQGYAARPAHILDFERMVLPGGNIKNAQFFPYGSTLFIDELMNKFAARDYTEGKGMPKEMRDFLRLIRHRGIAVVTNSLVPTGADNGIRTMSQSYMLIVHRVDEEYKGRLRTTWYCLEFDNDKSCAKFDENPKRGDIPYVPYIFVHDGDIHRCVNSEGENDQFLVGMEDREFEFKDWEVA